MERLRKIVFTVTNDLTYDQRMHRICNSLSHEGYHITLVGFTKKNSAILEQQTFEQKRIPMLFKKGKLFFIEYNFKLFFWLLFRNFDIYGGIDLDTLFPIYLVGRLKRKPIVYDAHEYYCELPEILNRPFIKKIWLLIENILLKRIKYNYTVSNTIANALSAKYHQYYEVIRNVPLISETQTDEIQSKGIIYQGALNVGRGIEELILAMEWIEHDLFIIGEGDISQKLRQIANSKSYKERIHFLGYITPVELNKFTRQAFIGVNLIQNLGLSYYYSLSNKFFDYIHAHIPQITMNFPEYQLLNDKYKIALLIDSLDPRMIANSINTLYCDTNLYHSLQANTYKASIDLSWNKEEIKLLEFYKNVK